MKLLTLAGSTSPVAVTPTTPTTAAATPTRPSVTAEGRRPRLPRDAIVQFNNDQAELYINMTITKVEHIHALMETLNTYAPQLEFARRRNDDR
jgi:hypothetical protein